MKLEVLRSRLVRFPGGYCGEKWVRVTEVRLAGTNGWVREWRRASGIDHFTMSSGQRLGHKADADRVGVEVLQLAAPAHIWDRMARAIAELDTLGRPVERHQRWTIKTAPRALRDRTP